MSVTTKKGFPLMESSQSEPEVVYNSAMEIADALGTVYGASTVADLPATPVQSDRAFVTDANATTFLSTVAGGGSNAVPVVFDGTNWVIG